MPFNVSLFLGGLVQAKQRGGEGQTSCFGAHRRPDDDTVQVSRPGGVTWAYAAEGDQSSAVLSWPRC